MQQQQVLGNGWDSKIYPQLNGRDISVTEKTLEHCQRIIDRLKQESTGNF